MKRTPDSSFQEPNQSQTFDASLEQAGNVACVSFRDGPHLYWDINHTTRLAFAFLSWSFRGLVCFWLLLTVDSARAHVGDQNVFFEGQAGPYPVRIVVRPPGVIPGLAEISVRVETNGVQHVTLLPIRWNTGRQGAPPPDEAKPVRGETNLFSGELWFMRDGAQSVEIQVIGRTGIGRVTVPVNAIATRVLAMPHWLGSLLVVLGALLVLLAVSIAAAAIRESVVPPGEMASSKRRWLSRGSAVAAGTAVVALLWFGSRWWKAEASDYSNNRLYRPVPTKATVREQNGRHILTLQRGANPLRGQGPLVPEHGKLMHLFLVREPQMDAFAHLHPTRLDWKTFEVDLPDLPPGEYHVYADLTYETGYSDTLTATVHLSEPATVATGSARLADPDDAWRLSAPFSNAPVATKRTTSLSPTLWMDMTAEGPLVENRDTRLHFKVRDVILRPAMLEHYMGMAGHLMLRREDGAVFTHLHPSGSFSMAAQKLFELRSDGKAPLKVASSKDDPICRLPAFDAYSNAGLEHNDIAFPYAFPKAGDYRLWVQVKVRGEILTGVFDVDVASSRTLPYATAESRR